MYSNIELVMFSRAGEGIGVVECQQALSPDDAGI